MSREIVLPPEDELPAILERVRRKIIDDAIVDADTAQRAIEVIQRICDEEYAKERADEVQDS